MSEFGELLKPELEPCACGCGLQGRPRKKVWKDGTAHVPRCQCRRCKGGRQGGNARRRENRIAKQTGGERAVMSGALSGYDGRSGLWVWEETSNVALVQGLRRWWESKQIRTKTARLMALNGYARAFIATWDGKPRLVVIPYEDWAGQVESEAS